MALKKPDTQTGISSEKNHTILIKWLLKIENVKNNNNNNYDYNDTNKNKIKWKEENVRSGIWTHALSREPELESGALDHSAILTI